MKKTTAFDVVACFCTELSAAGGDSLPLCQIFLRSLLMAPAEQALTACGNHASRVWRCLAQFLHLFPASTLIPQGWDSSGFILRGEDGIRIPWRSHPHTRQECFCQRWCCSWHGAPVLREGRLQQKSLSRFWGAEVFKVQRAAQQAWKTLQVNTRGREKRRSWSMGLT